jgi:type IV pilus assembly protein PilW
MRAPTLRNAAAQRGISLIEMMVGVVIGLIAVLVIYQTFSVAEGVKRQTISAGDAQKTGMIAMYLLGSEMGNAGSGIMLNQDDLATCTDTGDVTTTMRPFSVLITPGADDATPDSVVVNYSTSRSVVTPSVFMAKTDAGGTTFTVQSPTGFK